MTLYKPLDRRKLKWILIRRGRMVAKNINECWLDTNYFKGYINHELHFAGIKLRTIYERTTLSTTIDYNRDRIDNKSFNDPNVGRLNAIDKLKQIELHIGRKDYKLSILHCCDDYSYGEIAKKENLSRQTVAKRMKISLKNLYYIFNNHIVR